MGMASAHNETKAATRRRFKELFISNKQHFLRRHLPKDPSESRRFATNEEVIDHQSHLLYIYIYYNYCLSKTIIKY